MQKDSAGTIKPSLYHRLPLPLQELSPASFEDFVYQALTQLGGSKGFDMLSGRQPSGDHGFDCMAEMKGTRELVCIQCKRFSKALNTDIVAEEIVKVALESTLNKSTVKQHYIITSGTVSESLRQTLRQNNYFDLKNTCAKIVAKKKPQLSLLKNNNDKTIEPLEIINKYIDSLDKLLVWSGVDFQNELVVIWQKLGSVLENHFSIEKILQDNPTPNFDAFAYLKKRVKCEKKLFPLYFNQSTPPTNLINENPLDKYKGDIFSVDEIIKLLKENKNILLSSPGGSGKSYTLTEIEQVLSQKQHDIQFIPVKINLRSYSRNTLDKVIAQELGINYGSWKSLPFKFIFLFDGLDEMLQHDTQSFFDDLFSILDENSYIITVRNTGLSVGTTSNTVNACFSIQPLSYRSVFHIASETFSGEPLRKFYDEYRKKINITEYNFLSSLFVLSLSIDYYKKHNELPINVELALEDWVSRKITNDQRRVINTSLKINKIPATKIAEVYSLILYKASFEYDTTSISEDAFITLIMECYNELKAINEYLPQVLALDEFIAMIHHYEIMYKGDDGFFSTPHAIIADYLSSKISQNIGENIEDQNLTIDIMTSGFMVVIF